MKNPYSNIPAAIWLLATVTLISRSGSMVLVFLPLYLTQELGFDVIVAGQIISLYGLGQIAGSYSGGIFTDQFGSVKVQALALLSVGILYILIEFLSIKFMIMLCMFFVGLFAAAIRPATGATITRFSSSEVRTRAYALNYQALNLGMSIGPAIGGMLASVSYLWLFRLDGAANIAAAIVFWMFFSKRFIYSPGNLTESRPDVCLPSVWQDKLFMMFLLLICLTGICFFQLMSIYPLYLNDHCNMSTVDIGILMTFNGLLIIIFQMPLVTMFKKYNVMRIIGVGSALICAGFFILPWGNSFHFFLLSMGIITLGEMMVMPLAFDIVTKIAPAKNQGKYLGLLSCALSSVPLLVTPNLMPYIYAKFGSDVLWLSMGFVGMMVIVGFELLNATSFRLRTSVVKT